MGGEASDVEQLLQQQLIEARLELEQLELLIQQVPELMEQRYLHELRQVAHKNHQLLSERQQLIQRLEQGHKQRAKTVRWAWPTLKPLPTWQRTLLLCGLGTGALAGLGAMGWQHRVELWTWLQEPRTTEQRRPLSTQHAMPVAPVADAETIVTLDARDASWLEVINAQTGELLLQDTLTTGETRRIRLRSGLRLYAARPEALRYSLDGTHFQPWPSAGAAGWLELKPRPAGLSRS